MIMDKQTYNMKGLVAKFDGVTEVVQSVKEVSLAKVKYLMPLWFQSCDQVIVTKSQMEE